MPRVRLLLVSPLLLGAALAACSSSSHSGQGASAPADPPAASAASAASAPTSVPATSASPTTSVAVTDAPDTSAPPTSAAAPAAPPGAGSVITFTGKVAGRMSVTACSGGIAQLRVEIDGQGSTYPGIIDADDFTFVGPDSTGYTLAKGAAKPRVSGGGTTFTVHGAKLVGILNDDTVTASGSVSCP